MPNNVRDINDFEASGNQQVGNAGVRTSHEVSRVQEKGGQGPVWIKKELNQPGASPEEQAENMDVARSEVLAQEFFRLLIPHQPATQLAKTKDANNYFILSQEVQGYKPLPQNQQKNFTNNTYTGLGQAMLVSMFLQEIDLKNGNIGLDDQNRVIKIDGDWCFAERRMGETGQNKYQLTEQAIAGFPNPTGFNTFNWLDITQHGVKQRGSNLVNPAELSVHAQFRAEVNESMLKICLLPDSLIETYVSAYIPVDEDRDYFIQLIQSRREALRNSAVLNPSFNAYMDSKAAKEVAQNFIGEIKAFKVGDVPLVSSASDIALIEKNVDNTMLLLNRLNQLNAAKHAFEQAQAQADRGMLTQVADLVKSFNPIRKKSDGEKDLDVKVRAERSAKIELRDAKREEMRTASWKERASSALKSYGAEWGRETEFEIAATELKKAEAHTSKAKNKYEVAKYERQIAEYQVKTAKLTAKAEAVVVTQPEPEVKKVAEPEVQTNHDVSQDKTTAEQVALKGLFKNNIELQAAMSKNLEAMQAARTAFGAKSDSRTRLERYEAFFQAGKAVLEEAAAKTATAPFKRQQEKNAAPLKYSDYKSLKEAIRKNPEALKATQDAMKPDGKKSGQERIQAGYAAGAKVLQREKRSQDFSKTYDAAVENVATKVASQEDSKPSMTKEDDESNQPKQP